MKDQGWWIHMEIKFHNAMINKKYDIKKPAEIYKQLKIIELWSSFNICSRRNCIFISKSLEMKDVSSDCERLRDFRTTPNSVVKKKQEKYSN